MSEMRRDKLSRVLGRYEVMGTLSAGGMAEILLGRLEGPSGFERLVVIKRILPHLARRKAFVDMFLDEARIAAGIRHPNVVQVHELGLDQGELFLVMEYIEGESVAGLLKRLWAQGERLGPMLAAHLVAEACAGLHAAHELTGRDGEPMGIVHRDISPQNVMVTYAGQVKVLDFGIAQARDRLAKTETGLVKGKYEYMSPEQCMGKSLDRRSDIFSLGVLLYELSANRRLFKRTNELLTLKAIAEEPIRPPSSGAPDYPPELEAICLRALERARDHRYASAAELRRDLLVTVRALGSAEAGDELLGGLMRRLFADRIAENDEMQRQARTGAAVPSIPHAHPDAEIETPAPRDEPGGSTAVVGVAVKDEPTAPRRKRGAALWASLVALCIAGSLAIVALRWQRPDAALGGATPDARSAAPPLDSTGGAALPVVEPSPVPPAPPRESKAPETTEVNLRIETTPSRARVLVGGRESGETPVDLKLAKGTDPIRLEVRRDGFVPWAQSIVPEANQSFVLTLKPARAAGGRASPRPGTTAKPAPAPSFWRLP